MRKRGVAWYRAGVLLLGALALCCNILLAMGRACQGPLRACLWLSSGGQFILLLLCLRAKRALLRDTDDDGVEQCNYMCWAGMVASWALTPYSVGFVKAFLAFAIVTWLVLCHLTPQINACVALRLGLLCLAADCFLVLILCNAQMHSMVPPVAYAPYCAAFTLYFTVHDWRQWYVEV